MVPAAIFIVAGIVSFIVIGSLGVGLGRHLERKGVGEGLELSCGVIIGVIGAGLVLWIITLIASKGS